MADVPEPYIQYIYIYILYWERGVWVENITSRKYVTELNYLQQSSLHMSYTSTSCLKPLWTGTSI